MRHASSSTTHRAPASAAVISRDGTVVAYHVTGSGRPVIVIPGALSTAADYGALAAALGASHTVYTIERRGRGGSGVQGGEYGMARECEDVAALQRLAGAELIFGHSYGGLIALEYALNHSSISKVAVYEPGVSIDGSIPVDWLPVFRDYLESNRLLDAFAALSRGSGPPRARRLPHWLMKLILPRVVPAAELQHRLTLLGTTAAEHEVIGALDGTCARYGAIGASVLLMHGGRTQAPYVAPANRALAAVVPNVAERRFPTLDHFGPDQTGPVEVAAALRAFFA